ncbi:MAG: hypothetical protein AAFU64_06390 [Bacteroidota bacterium]
MIITVLDENMAGQTLAEQDLEFTEEVVSVRDIISQRVIQEVEAYNKQRPNLFRGLIEPTEAEKALNGYKLKKARLIDAEKQVYVALDAFQNNGYFLLIDDIQAESLDQQIHLQEKTKISFIKLTPLVGG